MLRCNKRIVDAFLLSPAVARCKSTLAYGLPVRSDLQQQTAAAFAAISAAKPAARAPAALDIDEDAAAQSGARADGGDGAPRGDVASAGGEAAHGGRKRLRKLDEWTAGGTAAKKSATAAAGAEARAAARIALDSDCSDRDAIPK